MRKSKAVQSQSSCWGVTMIEEDTLVEMEERAARWEFSEVDAIPLNEKETEWKFVKLYTRREAELLTCEEYGVTLEEFHNALNARSSGPLRNSGDQAA